MCKKKNEIAVVAFRRRTHLGGVEMKKNLVFKAHLGRERMPCGCFKLGTQLGEEEMQ